MCSAHLTFQDISMLLNPLKHCSVCLFQKADAHLGGTSCLAMDHKTKIPSDNQGASNSDTNFKRSSAIYHTSHSGTLPSPKTTFSTILSLSINIEDVSLISPTVSDSLFLYYKAKATPMRSFTPNYSCFQVQKMILCLFSRVVDNRSYRLLSIRRLVWPQNVWRFNHINEKVVRLCSTLKNFTDENPLRNWPFSPHPKIRSRTVVYVTVRLFEF